MGFVDCTFGGSSIYLNLTPNKLNDGTSESMGHADVHDRETGDDFGRGKNPHSERAPPPTPPREPASAATVDREPGPGPVAPAGAARKPSGKRGLVSTTDCP